MDVAKNDLCSDDHWQQVDHLAFQQEIQHTMTSMQSFLALLISPPDNIVNEQPNDGSITDGQLTFSTLTNDDTMTPPTSHCPMTTHTTQEYSTL